jgi:hypothetical protein
LAEAEESIKHKQKNSTESGREGEVAHMQCHAYDEKDVKLMGVEESSNLFRRTHCIEVDHIVTPVSNAMSPGKFATL